MTCADTPKPGNALIIGGEPVWVGAPVRTWDDHGLEFRAGAKNARARTAAVDLIVLHVTGGEGAPPQVYRTLTARGLSCDFVIDADGVIWQHSDPATVCTYHAGHVNGRSVGVEIVNHGFTRDPKLLAKWSGLREQYETTIHGRKITMSRSHGAQHAATLALCDALTTRLAIPRELPRGDTGKLRTGAMTRAEVAGYRGVLGHFHLTTAKIDPGTDVLDTLLFAGYG